MQDRLITCVLFILGVLQVQAQDTTLAGFHLEAFPFSAQHLENPLDLLVDPTDHVWVLDRTGVHCLTDQQFLRIGESNESMRAQEWIGSTTDGLAVLTDRGTQELYVDNWVYDPQHTHLADRDNPRKVTLPDGQALTLTESGTLIATNGERTKTVELKFSKHSNFFELDTKKRSRLVFDPDNGVWVMGQNGLVLVSHLRPVFELVETSEPLGKIVQVIEDQDLNRRFIYSISGGLLVQELSSNKTIRYLRVDDDGERLGGTKWRVSNGMYLTHNNHSIYRYDTVVDNLVKLFDLRNVVDKNGPKVRINDMEAGPEHDYLYIGTDDNLLVVLNPVSGAYAIKHVKSPGSFSGINLILETALFGKDRGLIVAEHGQFLLDGMNGTPRPVQEKWPNLQFGPNFRGSGAKVVGDTLLVLSSFSDGLFLFNLRKDSLYRPLDSPEQILISDIHWDGKGHVYGLCRTGLMMYDISDNTMRMIRGYHGLPLENLYYRYISVAEDGEIFLGLTDRYTHFRSSDLVRDSIDGLYIEHLEVNGKRTSNTPYQRLGEVLNLSYMSNNVTMRLGATNHNSAPYTGIYLRVDNETEPVFHSDRDLIRFHALEPGDHHIEGSLLSEGPFYRLLTISVAPPFWRSWWFIGLVATTILGIVFLIFRLRVNHVRHEAEMTAEFNSRIAQLELNSLRAQMHPHFIFNSLNSIKSFIAENEPRTATRYLNKFSQLIRSILNNSQHARIDLRSELHALKLYLELEQMRFEKSFDLSIDIDPTIDQDEVTIPPMILQPYAENAIWHGLMHKEGERRLIISISKEDDGLKAIIKDNGIGREAARALKSKSATKHRSLGMKITEEILQRTRSDGSSGIQVSDLVDDTGHACGTEVAITIPIIQK
jgi:hypothetical protein